MKTFIHNWIYAAQRFVDMISSIFESKKPEDLLTSSRLHVGAGDLWVSESEGLSKGYPIVITFRMPLEEYLPRGAYKASLGKIIEKSPPDHVKHRTLVLGVKDLSIGQTLVIQPPGRESLNVYVHGKWHASRKDEVYLVVYQDYSDGQPSRRALMNIPVALTLSKQDADDMMVRMGL